MDYLQAVILGIIQGVTEFLPVSSSGHLVLTQELLRASGANTLPKSDSVEMLFFNVMVHIGTLLAVVAVFRKTFGRFFGAFVSQCRQTLPMRERWQRHWAIRLFVLTIIATGATGVMYFLLKKPIEHAFASVTAVGVFLLVTGSLLFATRFIRRKPRGLREIGPLSALVIGLAQGCALAPGISRSGSTICTGLLCGMRRQWAAHFAFLLFVPAVLAALFFSAKNLAEKASELNIGELLGPVLVGSATAAVVGYFFLRLLLSLIRRSRLWLFSFYCWPVGIAAIVYGLLKSGS